MERLWGANITLSQLQQSISNLKKLDNLPDIPRENIINLEDDPTRQLSVAREKEIASNLAFLSSTSDNTRKVMAVCVEERQDGKGLTIRVASNTGDLSTVTEGLVRLARVLEHAARRERSRAEDIEVAFRNIISLDLYRILSRLRSRHLNSKKTRGKTALIGQLYNAIHDHSIKSTESIRRIRSRVCVLRNLFTNLECIAKFGANIDQAKETLGELLKQIHAFTTDIDLGAALQMAKLEPSLKEHLSEAMGKISRYYSTTSELVCAARHETYRLFENINVESFQIRVPTPLLRRECKVHAEIQLLFFYELHPELPRPRFICSSKSACYMCNLFFSIHGGFHIPRTHGKLYDKWTLPTWLELPTERHSELNRVSTLLKQTIDEKAVQASQRRRKKAHSDPRESFLQPPAHYSSSRISSQVSQASVSTIRARSTHLSLMDAVITSSKCTPLPPTPPITLLGPVHAELIDIVAEKVPTPTNIFSLTIGEEDLPYRRMISLTTPVLHLNLGTLFLSLEFLRVVHGSLFITRVEDSIELSRGYHVVDTESIPTHEHRVDCPLDSNKLMFQFRTAGKDMVCISFLWGTTDV